ncbi:CoA transferase [Altererythrobacter sp. ZODW24]|uniref:CoA transferase n=1 Tax=Altererythrobacter sp. ZODW24 TaxID=2185142 RepID=UPI001F073133|nr:CoA transferase [Altererythrobacter sp. ZODW24]
MRLLSGAAHFYRCYECADGEEIAVGAIEPQFYAELLEKLNAPKELLDGQNDPENWSGAADKLADLFKTKSAAEWSAILDGSDACSAPVLSLDDAFEHPHVRARDIYKKVDGTWHTSPAPRFARTPGKIRGTHADGASIITRWNS